MKGMRKYLLPTVMALMLLVSCSSPQTSLEKPEEKAVTDKEQPQIVNIIHFIRGVEPRDPNLNLLEPVENQLRLLKEHNLPGTFLIQYDAMMQPEFVSLLKDAENKNIEIGGWFEVVQPLVEKAGLAWRGRPGFAWDWFANIGFSIGYTTAEREKLVDVYMEDFKTTFGAYPKSIGSWIIDAHTLNYMKDAYNIQASCICRDQWGTDGYSLWGGYYNQGYYPSKNNVFSPAQTPENQIQVPVFRMLGSDPIYQYDAGLMDNGLLKPSGHQPVFTLEPVYKDIGGNPDWVDWYFKENFNGKALSFGYTQVGQENSFGWWGMKDGLEYQMQKVADEVQKGRIQVQTLGETGEWYAQKYQVTPPSAVTVLSDWKDTGYKSVWYNNRYYRANFVMMKSKFWIRDMHKFDENYKERYLTEPNLNESFVYDNLPMIDGNRWSYGLIRAGIKLAEKREDGAIVPLDFNEPTVEELAEERLRIRLPLKQGGELQVVCDETGLRIVEGKVKPKVQWMLSMEWSEEADSAVQSFAEDTVSYRYNEYDYQLKVKTAKLEKGESASSILMVPEGKEILLDPK